MEHTQSFAPLLIVIFLAFIVPILLSHLKRVKLPVVVGEIIAGVLVGPAILNWVQEEPILALLGNIGLAFLMFLAGIEIDFRTLFPERNGIQRKSEPNIAVSTFFVYILTLALAIPAAFLLNRAGLKGNPWILVFVLSATSLGVLLPILKERGLLHTQFGKAIFIAATLADFITGKYVPIWNRHAGVSHIVIILHHPGSGNHSVGRLFATCFLCSLCWEALQLGIIQLYLSPA